MTPAVIFKAVIKKALKNGYSHPGITNDGLHKHHFPHRIRELIYDHSFAKALWGEGIEWRLYGDDYEPTNCGPSWKYHLKKMVLEPNPLKYLEQFV